MSEIPDEFVEHAFKDYLRIVTGNAVIAAQYVERVFNGICLALKIERLPFDSEDLNSGDSSRMRQTLGAMKRRIADTQRFKDSFIDRVSEFVTRRNKLVHGLFCDTFHGEDEIHPEVEIALHYVAECEWVASEAAELVESGFGIFAELAHREDFRDENIDDLIRSFGEFRTLGSSALK